MCLAIGVQNLRDDSTMRNGVYFLLREQQSKLTGIAWVKRMKKGKSAGDFDEKKAKRT